MMTTFSWEFEDKVNSVLPETERFLRLLRNFPYICNVLTIKDIFIVVYGECKMHIREYELLAEQ